MVDERCVHACIHACAAWVEFAIIGWEGKRVMTVEIRGEI
jgi:hypothetical protein